MKKGTNSKLAFCAFSVTAAAALLAACNGGGSPSSVLTPSTGISSSAIGIAPSLKERMTLTARISKPVHKDHRKSWISPDARRAPRLLFVSDDGTNDIDILTMPGLALKGQLTGFSEPQGMCTDASGNIWVTNTGTNQVLQLSRTGSLLKTLSDPTGFPVGCSVNRLNNDLAVTNIIGNPSGDGNLVVYANSTGTPQQFADPSVFEYFFPTYDNNGNLFVDGEGSSGDSLLEIAAGSSTFSNITISGASLFFPGGLNWDGATKSLVIGDQECNGQSESCLYSATVSDGVATITGVTYLLDPSGQPNFDADQLTIAPQGRFVAGGIISEDSNPSAMARWAFPAGGVPINFNDTTAVEPIGAAISNK
jgi:NHL repeat